MKTKASKDKNIEKKIANVFHQRDANYKSYGNIKRVPRQEHYAVTMNKKGVSK